MPQTIEQEFGEAVRKIAAAWRKRRGTGLETNPYFQPIIDRHGLKEFRDYIAENFGLDREDGYSEPDDSPNQEIASLHLDKLAIFDPTFVDGDRILIFFDYSEDWKSIIGFDSGLTNTFDI